MANYGRQVFMDNGKPATFVFRLGRWSLGGSLPFMLGFHEASQMVADA